ncbi:MAG: 4-hydroxy-tetrahydrodipicolinate reductase [Bacteroidota bacterium]|nr:4-hydroxy-tetrahydrodipicolinate reductase [Bacteroidota bacterium]
MNIALIGYGKMGKEIEQICLERNHTVSLIIDINNQADFTVENLKKADVAIEFSKPETALANIRKCFEADVPVVCGTTGWLEHFDSIVKESNESGKGFFYTSNYSLGVNIFFKMNQFLAKIMNNFPQYEVEMEEVHHTQKLDAPSGTAISLAHDIIKDLDRKQNWQLDGQDNAEALKITAVRRDTVPGIHTVKYESPVDFIEMTHSAKSRKGFALGAVVAAEFMAGKKGAFSMDDLLKF